MSLLVEKIANKTMAPAAPVVIPAWVSLPLAFASLTIVVSENGLPVVAAPENGTTPPDADPVHPLTVMTLPAVAAVALFHQTVPAPFVFAFWLASFVHVFPVESLSTTPGSAVASRLVTHKTRMSFVAVAAGIVRVNPVVWFPEVPAPALATIAIYGLVSIHRSPTAGSTGSVSPTVMVFVPTPMT